LFFSTEIKLNLVDALKPFAGLVCVHCDSINESLKANLGFAVQSRQCGADRSLYTGLYQRKYRTKQNRFFVQGDPKAILVVEFLRF
jgi:hypothetical protein